jgi:hypothetical protein
VTRSARLQRSWAAGPVAETKGLEKGWFQWFVKKSIYIYIIYNIYIYILDTLACLYICHIFGAGQQRLLKNLKSFTAVFLKIQILSQWPHLTSA